MDCESVKKHLPFYYYNDLDKTMTLGIKSHMKNCSYCQKELNYLKKTLKLVGKEEKIKLPFAHRQALLNRSLEASNLKEERRILQTRRIFTFGSGFAAAMFLFFFLFLNFRFPSAKLNWENELFTYSMEELDKKINKAGETIPEEPLLIPGYSLDEKIGNIYEEMEELIAFSNYNSQ